MLGDEKMYKKEGGEGNLVLIPRRAILATVLLLRCRPKRKEKSAAAPHNW